MAGGLGHERVGAGDGFPQFRLYRLQQTQHGLLRARVGEMKAERAELTCAKPVPAGTGAGDT
ncbi:hypothetical protein GCM10009541_25980 [Micromonospora gifhornensis]